MTLREVPEWSKVCAPALSALGLRVDRFVPLSGDVSPRRYARLHRETGGSLIAAAYPPELAETAHRFEKTTDLLRSAGVVVPDVLYTSPRGDLMLLEDVGRDTLYAPERSEGSLEPWIERAVEVIGRIQRLDARSLDELSPPLDRALLWHELELTREAFFDPNDIFGPDGEEVYSLLESICQRLAEGPQVACHRDFMVRNLVPRTVGGRHELVVLDHQDLRRGPRAYDEASLRNDSLVAASAPTDTSTPPLFDAAVVQRMLKIVGTFVRFASAGSTRYLALVEPSFRRATRSLERIPETAELAFARQERWMKSVRGALALKRRSER